MANRRTGWSKLTADYRRRLERTGITRRQWERGADLRSSRGHRPPPTLRPNVADAYAASIARNATEDQVSVLRSAVVPWWVPKGLAYDVRVAFAQFRQPPSQWRPGPNGEPKVTLLPRANGDPWTVTVWYARSPYPHSFEIPGGGGAGSGAREFLDVLKHPELTNMAPVVRLFEWASIDPDEDVDVDGSL